MHVLQNTNASSYRFILLCSLFVCCFLNMYCGAARASSDSFSVACEKKIISYEDNTFRVTAPESGDVEITIRDDNTIYRILSFSVDEGENRCKWDGLGWQQERLKSKSYQIHAVLTGFSGTIWKHTFRTYVEYSAQALIFALPSADTVYLDDPESWFLEAKTVLSGTLTAELIRAGENEPAYTWSRSVRGGKIIKLSFSALCGKKIPDTGLYNMRVYAAGNAVYDSVFSLRIERKTPEMIPLQVTGDPMPNRLDSDEVIWQKMIQPAVVVDIDPLEHQQVYAEPDERSRKLGTLHGQSQTLNVLEIVDNWARIGAWNHEEAEYVEGWVPAGKLKTVEAQKEYGLLLDKKEQTITVFRQGARLDTLLVSTGRMETNELYQETAAGSFLTGFHRVDFSTNGLKYDFVIQYDGGNMLHQIPYAWGKEKKDFTPGKSFLGTKASHACVRVQAEPGTGGLNVYWIWTHIPYHTRLVILDDPEERQKEKILITESTPDYDSEMTADSAMEDGEEETEDELILTFAGDAVLGGREAYYGRKDSLMAYVEEKGFSWLFSGLQYLFSTDDCTVINLECVLKNDRSGEELKKQWRFRGYTNYAEQLPESSVELVNVANNHTIDYGEEGYLSTLAALEKQTGVCGNGLNWIKRIKGHLVGFGGCRETSYQQDPDIIEKDIASLRDQGCEIVIYQCHWGTEYSEKHNILQEAMARACVRAGADLVIGHHPHVVQGIDIINGVPVIYSLGNLCFGGTLNMKTYDAMVARVCFRSEAEKWKVRIRLIPILTSSLASDKINDFHPIPAAGEERLRILRQIQSDTPFALKDMIQTVKESLF